MSFSDLAIVPNFAPKKNIGPLEILKAAISPRV